KNGCPQQVWPRGNSAAWPTRFSTRSTASPTCGNSWSTRQVLKRATRIGATGSESPKDGFHSRCAKGPREAPVVQLLPPAYAPSGSRSPRPLSGPFAWPRIQDRRGGGEGSLQGERG